MSAIPKILEYFALIGLGVCVVVLVGLYFSHLSKRARIVARRYGVIGILAAAFFSFAAITEGPPDNDYKNAVQEELNGESETNALYGAMLTAPRRTLPARSPIPAMTHRLVYVVTNEVYDYTMPTNATEYAPWHLRGAAEDWARIEVGRMKEEGGSDWWRFPMGTNDYSAFRVFTDGTIRPKLHSTNDTISAVGAAMSAIPDVSRFWYTVGTNDSRVLTWENFVMGRIANSAVNLNLQPQPFLSAQIELFRSGDYIVRSNGVERLYRFVDPFDVPEEEWGQSEADKADIDAMVGTNLENGYYKLTVTVPPSVGRRTLITVGYQQLVADRPGEYAFLLEKGEEYELSLLPFSPDITYDAVDDIRPPMTMNAFGFWNDWTIGGGYLTLRGPTFLRPGCCLWLPTFKATPPPSHLGPGSSPTVFTAELSDYAYGRAVYYEWYSNDWNVEFSSPNSDSTTIEVYEMPSWHSARVTACVWIGTNVLESTTEFTYGVYAEPQIRLLIDAPNALLLNSNKVDSAKIGTINVSFTCDVETNGTLSLICFSGRERVVLGGELSVRVEDNSTLTANVEGVLASENIGDVELAAVFTPDDGALPVTNATALTVVRVGNVRLPGAPDDGLVVLRGTSIALDMDVEPEAAKNLLSTIYNVRRLRGDGTYENWYYAAGNYNGTTAIYNPSAGGIYQVQAFAGVGWGGTDERYYVWEENENQSVGRMKRGDSKAFGVCDEHWQITLRNSALSFLGSQEYLLDVALSAQYGFSSYPAGGNAYKCNIFVAHRAVQSGLRYSAIHGVFGSYPPLANELSDKSFVIVDWPVLSVDDFPQPGYITAVSGGRNGHCGIVDFDGKGISAGILNVNRYMNAVQISTTLRKYSGGTL